MRFETERNIFHLLMGCGLAVLVLLLGNEISITVLGICLILGIIISGLIENNVKVPIFYYLIKRMEREYAKPGRGVINFFLGSFIALIFFDVSIVFISILILAFGDSFSTVVGKGFGKRKIYKNKTLEGFLAGFIASFLVCSLFIPLTMALFVCYVASVIELFVVTDDNLFIPPISSLIIYMLIV